MVVAVIGMLAATAVPAVAGAMATYRLTAASRAVATQIAAARLTAVSTNRRMRVRLNCPAVGMFRVVEVTGNPAIDDAADRCNPAIFPFPDPDPAARPDRDGPLFWLTQTIQFGALQEIEISTFGRVSALVGALPAQIEVTDGSRTRTVTVTGAGRIQIQ